MILPKETIAAISTPLGEAGIGIVRMSGENAIPILKLVFRTPTGNPLPSPESHRVYYGRVVDPASGAMIDEVIVTVMKSPRSFTKEDVVEINCHSGPVVLKKILLCLIRNGARPAEPGEFSKRAFLNGRLDLIQAEALADLIHSKSEKGWEVSLNHLNGSLSRTVAQIQNRLVEISAMLEVSLDFPDEELEVVEDGPLFAGIRDCEREVADLVASYQRGRVLRDGVHITLTGRPNVGKSSLMNALLEENRVIVSPYPGTTRDTIEESVLLDGFAVKLIDTAGLREVEEEVEKLGVERSYRAIEDSDVVVFVFDGSEPLTEEDRSLLTRFRLDDRAVFVVNKCDRELRIELDSIRDAIGVRTLIHLSATEGSGLTDLRSAIVAQVEGRFNPLSDGPVLTRERHKWLFEQILSDLGKARESAEGGAPRELISVDVRNALETLMEVTGERVSDRILDEIFGHFCIGK